MSACQCGFALCSDAGRPTTEADLLAQVAQLRTERDTANLRADMAEAAAREARADLAWHGGRVTFDPDVKAEEEAQRDAQREEWGKC